MYNYWFSSSDATLIFICDCISEWRFINTLKVPSVFISFGGCITEGIISIFSCSFNIFEISVGFTDP